MNAVLQGLAGGAASKYVGQRVEEMGPDDPYYEYYNENGKQKRRRREMPPGLTPEEAKILRKLKKRAHRLDKGFSLCGMRFGWTFIIAIIPGAGDIADLLLNQALIVNKAKQLEGIPDSLVQRMVMNNAVSTGVGFIPIVGDFVIAAWKANSRNVNMVEKWLIQRAQQRGGSGAMAH